MQAGKLPAPEPGVFAGDVTKFEEWLMSFELLIEGRGINEAERIHYLKRYLGGSAREAIEGYALLPSDEAYREAKAQLNKKDLAIHIRYRQPLGRS